MALASMTGFARHAGHWESYRWTWEIKGVNGRNLDLRWRLPSGFDGLEQKLRGLLKAAAIARGSVMVNLQLQQDGQNQNFTINQDMLDHLVAVAVETAMRNHLPQPSLDALLSVKDVICYQETALDKECETARDQALTDSFAEALTAFQKSRHQEGAALQDLLETFLNDIEQQVKAADHLARTMPEKIRSRYQEKVSALLADPAALDPDRLAQEILLLATKADVREEIDRLYAHIAAARGHLKAAGPVGRKLDFLAQEFNREANTLCSKSSDISLTETGLALKSAIDQFREQVQNIE